ncbi:hypothetical protein L1987_10817 [Smallanthus sonchifolius]|uniref:Uncharacterized protein n=1 Tax=Smallanthus sonchifolius TaxID=185202 RepID=A0ACB9JB99_9ASTR|nr:hypothetical protein L1987_10817 [Smallanthus sonchifolius]
MEESSNFDVKERGGMDSPWRKLVNVREGKRKAGDSWEMREKKDGSYSNKKVFTNATRKSTTPKFSLNETNKQKNVELALRKQLDIFSQVASKCAYIKFMAK